MKKMIATLTALVLLLTLAAGWASAEDWTDYTCTEDSFSIRVPAGADVAYEEGNGLTIYTKAAGKIPYAIVHRRPADKKLSNPGNYLGNVYREYLEDKYGSDYMGMSDLGMWEAGGKELPGAKYRYRDGEYTVVLVKLLDIRDAADVEYTVKYVEGDESSIMPAVNEAVRTYRETDSPAASGRTEKPQTQKAAVEPADVSGIKPDTQNGSYWVRVMNEHKINNGGYFTADLYIPDVYSLQDINSLREGDRIRMDGKEWTVAALMPEENGLRELRVKEEFDGYFAFRPRGTTPASWSSTTGWPARISAGKPSCCRCQTALPMWNRSCPGKTRCMTRIPSSTCW